MDAVELPFSVEVSSATKLIGSVAVKELEACTSFISEKSESFEFNSFLGVEIGS